MNPDDENRNHNDFSRDADKFHIAPEYGEQGEGPGEQPVRRVNTTDGFKKPVSINITEVKSESIKEESPAPTSPFNHGADDVMQYFTTEKEEISYSDEEIGRDAASIFSSGGSGGHDRGVAAEPRNDGREERASREKMAGSIPQGLSAQRNGVSPAGIDDREKMAGGIPQGLSAQRNSVSHPKPKKKTNLVSTIAIVLITVLITAVAVFAILVLTQGHSKDNQITTNEVVTKVETDSITCTKSDASDDEKSAAGDATAINTTIISNYTNKDMDDYSVMKRYTYENSSAAEAGLKKVKDAYMGKYIELLDLNVDPFSSTYAQKDTEVTESHFAEASDITSENIDLINIPKPSNGTTPDISVVESTLKTSGYTCKVKSAE